MRPNTAAPRLDLPDRHVDVGVIAKSLGGKRSGDGWVCHCPAHEDKRVSLSLNESSDGKIA